MMFVARFGFGGALLLCLSASTAQAHIRLLEPESAVEESGLGDPQKVGPCGEPGTPTGAVTEFQAGETITVRWEETIYHPGHFRIALARDRSELADPDIEVDNSCNYAAGAVSGDSPEYPVLLDNLYPRTPVFGQAETFTHEVTLPADMTCEKCTLQVIQFMTNHGQPCIYYHCADIKIVAADGEPTDAGTGGAGSAGEGGTTGEGGTGQAGTSGGAMAPPMMTAGSGAAGTTGTTIGGIGTAGGAGSAGTGGMPAAMPAAGAAAPSAPASSSSSSSSGGCSAALRGPTTSTPAVLWLALLALRSRRDRRARAR